MLMGLKIQPFGYQSRPLTTRSHYGNWTDFLWALV